MKQQLRWEFLFGKSFFPYWINKKAKRCSTLLCLIIAFKSIYNGENSAILLFPLSFWKKQLMRPIHLPFIPNETYSKMDEKNQSESQPFVSIVTPVYNGEKYLTECVKSVLSQTYKNWEYIILDNCSTDRTYEIAKQYAKNDSRIKVCRNEKLIDVIENHNKSYQKISLKSKYCKLLHSDDFMFPSCLEEMIGLAERHPKIGIVGAYSIVGKKVRNEGLQYASKEVNGHTIARQTLLGKFYLFWSPSSLMIRSDLIRSRNPFYNPELLHADVDSLYILLRSWNFGFVHQILTFVRVHDNSLTTILTKPMNRLILSNLHLFLMHGPVFLKKDEFKTELKKRVNTYYRFLAENALELREIEFWRYHKLWLNKINFQFELTRLVKGIACLILYHPKRSILRLIRALYQKVKND
jgi:glycosyltransferase involved in cell wall biosynthesis